MATGATLEQFFKEIPVRKLYKDLILAARLIGRRQGNEETLVEQVRAAFKANKDEYDDDKVREHKEAAVRALQNVYFAEAERWAKDKRKK